MQHSAPIVMAMLPGSASAGLQPPDSPSPCCLGFDQSHPPRPEQPRGGTGQSAAPITPSTATAGAGEQRPLLRVLSGAGRTHRRKVADEIRRARHQLQTPRGQAADEVELIALSPVAEGKDRHPGAGLVVAGAAGNPVPDVVGEGALAQLQHHSIGTGDLAEVGAGAADVGGADEQRRRQLDQRRRAVEQSLGIEHQVVMADGDAAAQLVAVAVEAGAEGGGMAAKAIAAVAMQGHRFVGLPAGAGEDGDRVPARGARALVNGMAAVAVQLVVAAGGLEGPAEELLAWGGVLGDEQNRADRAGASDRAVDVGKPGAVGHRVAVPGRAFTKAARARKDASRRMPTPAGSLLVHFQLPAGNTWQNT